MLVEAIRLIIVLAFTAGAYQLGRSTPDLFGISRPETATFVVTALGAGVGYILGGIAARLLDTGMDKAETGLANRHASEVLAGVLGLLIGLVLATLLTWPILFAVTRSEIAFPAVALVAVVIVTYSTRFAVRKRLELFGVLGVPTAAGAGTTTAGCLLDSAAAIDGRVIALWKAGLLPRPLWVPSFILWELQGIADSADPWRRRRGQRGLDVLTSLREAGAEVRVLDEDPAGTSDPDAKLVVVARRRGLPLVTSDTNLAKAAELQGLQVLNLHALAELLRPPVLPGERCKVQLIKPGRETGQAVGYLDDGTMVVVERSAHLLGSEVDAEVTSVLQNPGGRMLFARLAEPSEAQALEAT